MVYAYPFGCTATIASQSAIIKGEKIALFSLLFVGICLSRCLHCVESRAVAMHVTVLGSGSAGNCTLVETETTSILVDAGLSARQIIQRLQLIGRSLDTLTGVVLTHEHTDHTRGLAVLCRSKPLPVYAN